VAAIGERRSAWLESVLGATPQEFESPILRHLACGDTESLRSAIPGWGISLGSILGSIASPGRAIAGVSRRCCAWSWASWTALNGSQHAAEACAPQLRAGRDRPRPGCGLLLRAAGYPPVRARRLQPRPASAQASTVIGHGHTMATGHTASGSPRDRGRTNARRDPQVPRDGKILAHPQQPGTRHEESSRPETLPGR
jgi:hypothetical protein